MRDLEELHVVVPHVDVVARGTDQADRQRRPQQPLLRAERDGQFERVGIGILRLQRVGVRLVEPRADEHVLDLTT